MHSDKLTTLPTPALPGSGSLGMISASVTTEAPLAFANILNNRIVLHESNLND
jgi:hypothetical protein